MHIHPTKRSSMSLYSGTTDAYSHRVRLVIAEKGVPADIYDVDNFNKAREELNELNPYGTPPLLVDRELVLYQSDLIMEYLDERFPHPPLMPAYPIARARSRLMIYRINRDWYSLMDKILAAMNNKENPEVLSAARKELTEGLTSIAPIFKELPFFLNETFSILDCCMAPLLWRLPILGISLPIQANSVLGYGQRLFQRGSFRASLTEAEEKMNKIER